MLLNSHNSLFSANFLNSWNGQFLLICADIQRRPRLFETIWVRDKECLHVFSFLLELKSFLKWHMLLSLQSISSLDAFEARSPAWDLLPLRSFSAMIESSCPSSTAMLLQVASSSFQFMQASRSWHDDDLWRTQCLYIEEKASSISKSRSWTAELNLYYAVCTLLITNASLLTLEQISQVKDWWSGEPWGSMQSRNATRLEVFAVENIPCIILQINFSSCSSCASLSCYSFANHRILLLHLKMLRKSLRNHAHATNMHPRNCLVTEKNWLSL